MTGNFFSLADRKIDAPTWTPDSSSPPSCMALEPCLLAPSTSKAHVGLEGEIESGSGIYPLEGESSQANPVPNPNIDFGFRPSPVIPSRSATTFNLPPLDRPPL